MNQLADQQQFLVVYPQHATLDPGDVNPIMCWNFFYAVNQYRDSGEAGSLAGIVDASAHDVLAYWRVEGMGHAWSGGSPGRPFTDLRGPNASLAMYQFFIAHALA